MKRWLTVDRVLMGLVVLCLLAVVVSQWVHAVRFDETVAAWEKCLVLPGQVPDCDDWSRIPEERRTRWLLQINAEDPLGGPEDLVLAPESYSEPSVQPPSLDLRAGFPAVIEDPGTKDVGSILDPMSDTP